MAMFIFIFYLFVLSRPNFKNNSPDLVDNDLVTPHMTSTNRSIMPKKKEKKIVICWKISQVVETRGEGDSVACRAD